MTDVTKRATTLAGGLALAFLPSACGGAAEKEAGQDPEPDVAV